MLVVADSCLEVKYSLTGGYYGDSVVWPLTNKLQKHSNIELKISTSYCQTLSLQHEQHPRPLDRPEGHTGAADLDRWS